MNACINYERFYLSQSIENGTKYLNFNMEKGTSM